MSVAAAPAASTQFDWKRWPDTEAFVGRLIDHGPRRASVRRPTGRADDRGSRHAV